MWKVRYFFSNNFLQQSSLHIFSGVGMKNEVVSVPAFFGRDKLLLTGLAVYASNENLEKLKNKETETTSSEAEAHSSRFSELVIRFVHCHKVLNGTCLFAYLINYRYTKN